MPIVVIGLSHHSAPVTVRERFAFAEAQIPSLLQELRDSGIASEGVILSTCNRTELYALAEDPDSLAAIWSMLARRLGQDPSAHGYVVRDKEAATHLFRVTAGLDSMIKRMLRARLTV